MAEQIEKFDPSTLMQGVKDRIKATFVSLIPDAQWDQMVKHEIEMFFKQTSGTGYNDRRDVSTFSYTVWQVLQEESKTKIKEILESDEFRVSWGSNGDMGVSEVLRNEIMKKAPEIFAQAVQNAIANTISNMRGMR